MGSHPLQARGLVLFLAGFVLLAVALAMERPALLAAAAGALAAAAVMFWKCKPWEHREE